MTPEQQLWRDALVAAIGVSDKRQSTAKILDRAEEIAEEAVKRHKARWGESVEPWVATSASFAMGDSGWTPKSPKPLQPAESPLKTGYTTPSGYEVKPLEESDSDG